MTLRGMFEGIFDQLDFEWEWKVELLEVDAVSLPVLLRGRSDLSSLREAVIGHLRRQQRKHEAFSDREFIYFVIRRPKLCLARSRPARLVDDQVELRFVKGDAWFLENSACRPS
jgi:hypothetical protein